MTAFSTLAGRPVLRMNGAGNAITVLDLRGTWLDVDAPAARAIARDPALAFDQLMVLHDPRTPGTEAFVTIRNTDGSSAGACGNGTRCVAWALLRDDARTAVTIETGAGLIACQAEPDGRFTVDMGEPLFAAADIPLADPAADTLALQLNPPAPDGLPPPVAISMGNPHAVFFVPDAAAIDLAAIGPAIEHHRMFPDRVNVSFATVAAPNHLLLRVWERGAGATLACGTAACASVVAGARLGLTDRRATVSLPGGDLIIDWRTADGRVWMTGPVELEAEHVLPPDLFAGAA